MREIKLLLNLKSKQGHIPLKRGGHQVQQLHVSPIHIAYSSSHKYYNDKGQRNYEKKDPRDDLRDLKIEPLVFDGNLKLENYPAWVQAIRGIFKLKEYNGEKAFKIPIIRV